MPTTPVFFCTHPWTHTVLRIFMIHCYFKSYETYAVLPIIDIEGLWWRRQIGTPLLFYGWGLPRAAKQSKHTQTTALLGRWHTRFTSMNAHIKHSHIPFTMPLHNVWLKQQLQWVNVTIIVSSLFSFKSRLPGNKRCDSYCLLMVFYRWTSSFSGDSVAAWPPGPVLWSTQNKAL